MSEFAPAVARVLGRTLRFGPRQGLANSWIELLTEFSLYFKYAKTFRVHGHVRPRLQAWHDSPATSAVFGAANWHLSESVVKSIRTWELERLRRMFRMRRKPEESQATFNKRSAVQIFTWFGKLGLKMAFHRVIKQVYKSAWLEQFSPCCFSENPLLWSRECRSQSWWAFICVDESRKTRRIDGLQHRHRGHQRTSWEQPFVTVFGEAWRAFRDSHHNLAHWMQGCGPFTNQLCSKWGLPGISLPNATKLSLAPIICRIPTTIVACPELPAHPMDQEWQTSGGRLWIQIDCKSVAELVAGRATLEPTEHTAIYKRIVHKLLRLHALHWNPMKCSCDFVVWSPREYNVVADHAANAAMDEERDFSVECLEAIGEALAQKMNLRLCVDGGRRSETQGALGFALFTAQLTESGCYKYTVLARKGKLLNKVSSAFVAETVALEWALDYLLGLLCKAVT